PVPAPRPRLGLRRRVEAAARHFHHRRARPLPAPHALYHARRLRIYRPLPAVVPEAVAQNARRRRRAGGRMMRPPHHPLLPQEGARRGGAVRALIASIAVTSTLGLAGCKAGPDYVRPEVEAPAAYRETQVHCEGAGTRD